ncbi:MAG: phospho-N-acetylmuramoyl-pentapeptide-transferase [Firmicutes bacterium]|nr:phospho-N-acetylmuramoyl-pentapeptide-transferase [Bacillota bacterium]
MFSTVLYAALLAFLIALIAGPTLIRFLRRLKFGQTVRTDGPQTHLKKSGTPTMGGILIVPAAAISTMLLAGADLKVNYCLLATIGFSLIGLIDDYIIVVAKRPLGLKARHKLLGEIILGLVISMFALTAPDLGPVLAVPFSGQLLTLPPWLFVIVATGAVVGSANAVNFTDGLDGLAAGTTAIASVAYALLCIGLGEWNLAAFAAAIAGACLGFTWFNAHPAQVIMGDTGSLGLGAALGAMAVVTSTELFLVIIGGVFVIETLSVMLQVSYFRLTGGRRIFRMAPLHHHFELKGWPETKVVFRFWLIGFVFAVIGLAGFPAALGY